MRRTIRISSSTDDRSSSSHLAVCSKEFAFVMSYTIVQVRLELVCRCSLEVNLLI